tara:strand:- start:1144 stop:1899 length:756 start_codon:yes stop_codon:yes gene_type:complete
MDDYIIKNFIYFIILLGILIYFLYFLNPKDILNYLSNKEHLVNLYKPNKVFYHDNKIYIIDTNHIIDDANPKIFDSYEEFQKYIINLEDKHLIKLPLKKEDIKDGVNIQNLKYDKDLSLGLHELPHFKNSSKCFHKEALCNLELDDNSKDITIFDKEKIKKIKKIKKKECHINFISKGKCKEIGEIIDDETNLNRRCYREEEKSDICKKYNKYRWNQDLLKNFCVKKTHNYNMDDCLIGEYFKENLLDFGI